MYEKWDLDNASTNYLLGITKSISKPVIVEDNCFIGHQAIVLMGVKVGAGSIVGAGAVVTKDVHPGTVVAGNPAKVLCSVQELVENRINLAMTNPEFFRELPDITSENL